MMDNNVYILTTVFITLLGAALSLLLARYNRVQRIIALITSTIAFAASLGVLLQVIESGPQTYRMGGWVPPYGIVLVADNLSALFGFMAASVMLCGMIYAYFFKDKAGTYPAFFPLFLMMETGLNGAFYTGDLFSLFVFFELMVISSVTLTAISDDRLGLEAAFKYVFISGIGSFFLLLGIAAMYGAFGTLNLADMAQQLQAMGAERPLLANAAAVMLTGAFLLKSAVFPFHFWQPDFHTTAPTPVSAMLSSVIVKVGIYGIIRLITLLFTVEAPQVGQILIVLGIVGIFFGSFSAMQTYNGKRLLAYSTISQIGFILVPLGWYASAPADTDPALRNLALTAAIVYAFSHAFIKSGLLMTMGLVASYTKPKSADFKDLEGVGRKIPAIVGVLWFLGGMALAGIPPLSGFIGKLTIVQSGVGTGQWLALFLLVFGGILTTIYMYRAWQYVFQTKVEKEAMTVKIKDAGDSALAPAILIGVTVVLGLYARPLVQFAEQTVLNLNDPDIYINAVRLFTGS
jgi:multicomponent Na+:H+ antiporter subunit D